ncbi:hypothetical protein HGA88_05705 [Candidatus Roizmanbacteria bacterium]|nr:hypothetical protein [Candidatus Roizmanbacteria bacterium]
MNNIENPVTKCIAFLKTLSDKEWNTKVDAQWRVRDVVAHLINWETEVVKVLPEVWQSRKQPWFMQTDNFDVFNHHAIEKYKTYTPQQLIETWINLEKQVQEEIAKIGAARLQAVKNDFDWFFDDDEKSHVLEHLNQIKTTLGKHVL